MINKTTGLFMFVAVLLVTSCKNEQQQQQANQEVATDSVAFYKEPYRPQFHFTPKEKWMNDPNGLVYHKGVYHLFYQYYPDGIVWGPMHWGHAVSKNMVHWEHKPIALYPDKLGLIFSGSAVVDIENTSGFGTLENPPLVAIFTYHNMEKEKAGRLDFQTQGIAYSLDNGDTWAKYEGNPVIGNTNTKDFRDPKVFWHDGSKQWIMALVAGDRAQFYGSKDLKKWNFLSEFGKDAGAHGGVWECPDLFKLTVEGSQEEKWVLIISISPGAPNGGSGTQYFIGDFDGKTFSSPQKEAKWLDLGTDNYAGVTYNNTPNNERIFIGWMSNWSYARNTPTERWRSAMTLPRSLSLASINDSYFLKNYPLPQFDSLVVPSGKTEEVIEKERIFSSANFNQSQLVFTTESRDFELNFSNAEGDTLKLKMDKNTFSLDRTKSGLTTFEKSFGDNAHQTDVAKLPQGSYEVRIILDWSSIEVFINGGQYVMTEQVFPKSFYKTLLITNRSANNLQLHNFQINSLKSLW